MEFEIINVSAVDDKLMMLNVKVKDTTLTVIVPLNADDEMIAKEVKRYYDAYLEEKRREEELDRIKQQLKDNLTKLVGKKIKYES